MSFYRQSPNKRSPYSRSPVKGLQSQLDFIQEQIKLKNAYRNQAQNRRLLDQISLLQMKMRKIDQLQARSQALVKQNSILTSQNDQMAKQLSERRYQIQRIRASSFQLQQRDTIKSTQLGQINRSLQIEIQLLKKERIESSKLYEVHIQKLQIMLQDKIKQSESLSVKCNELVNQRQIAFIKFQQQRNKLKNLMSRTSYDMQRQLQYTKQKQTTQKFVQIETLKKNYSSQIILLDDQISKLKAANSYKNTQFENQLLQNRNIKNRYEEEVKKLLLQNDSLRQRILKLQEMNKTQVQNIQQKYNNIHTKGTTSLKQQHQRQIKLLLDQIDREKWIINQKNNQIQNLIRQKRDQQSSFRQRELFLVTETQTLKNKLNVQQVESAQKNHQLLNKINDLHNKNLRDNQSYFERVKNFQNKIKDLQRQVDTKQGQCENLKSYSSVRISQLNTQLQQTKNNLRKTSQSLREEQQQHKGDLQEYNEYRKKSQYERVRLSQKISQLQVRVQQEIQRNQGLNNEKNNSEQLLSLQIKSLRETVSVLERKQSKEQERHSKEMSDLSSNVRQKVERLQSTNKKTLQEIKSSHNNEIETLRRRIQKLERQKQQMQSKLKEYIKLYDGLQKYFKQPHKQAIFKEKASSSIYEVLDKTANTTIHIF